MGQNDEVMREWNHLNKIISADPIDYSQIDFYLLLSNKNNNTSQQNITKGSQNSITSSNKNIEEPNKYRYNEVNSGEKNNFEKKGSFMSNNLPNNTKKYELSYIERIWSQTCKTSKNCWSSTSRD